MTVLLAIGTAMAGIVSYVHSTRNEALAATRESQRPFLEEQLKRFVETSTVIAKLSTLDPTEQAWKEASVRFDQLFWSDLALVENRDVESRMAEFRMALEKVRKGVEKAQILTTPTVKLAHALRASITARWGDQPSDLLALQ